MITELGHFALIVALPLAFIGTLIPLLGAHRGWINFMRVGNFTAVAQFLLVLMSFCALTYAFVTSDFSVRLVTLNSHTDKPMIYKISGVWGNHEGSILLWVLILTMFGAVAAVFGRALPAALKARVLAVQSSISFAFLAFTLLSSNPFLRLEIPPFNGQDLNPLLQDPGLAFHPPFLYLGYVGLSMAFSFAIAALIEGRVDASFGRWVRPWTLAAWVFLTIGIGLGSWWAYYELGWGGFWFWDPVENASFMPWLFATALLHSAIVVEKREALKAWSVLLAILAFSFSLIGTFIVRSGIITSVHAFATDPARGVLILLILMFFTGGALTLFAFRSSALQARGIFSIASRESALVLNNILLAVSSFVVFIGTIWPLVGEAFGRKIAVGAPFFETAFTPFMVVLALLLPLGSILPWKRAQVLKQAQKLIPAAILALSLAMLSWSIQTNTSALGPIGLLLGAWVFIGALTDLLQRRRREPFVARVSRLRKLPRADWGKFVAHGGFAVTIMGISGLIAWQHEDIRVAELTKTYQVAEYQVTLKRVYDEQGPNYASRKAEVTVRPLNGSQASDIITLYPEKRFYPVQSMPTTEAAIYNGFWRDIYVVIGDEQVDGGYALRVFIKPFANWIWAGVLLMGLGGLLSLTDRRHRIAPPATRRRNLG